MYRDENILKWYKKNEHKLQVKYFRTCKYNNTFFLLALKDSHILCCLLRHSKMIFYQICMFMIGVPIKDSRTCWEDLEHHEIQQ